MFLQLLGDQHERETIGEGLVLLVKHYYEDYTDADELDPNFYRALETVAEYSDMEVNDIIVAGQMLVKEVRPGRKFKAGHPEEDDEFLKAWRGEGNA